MYTTGFSWQRCAELQRGENMKSMLVKIKSRLSDWAVKYAPYMAAALVAVIVIVVCSVGGDIPTGDDKQVVSDDKLISEDNSSSFVYDCEMVDGLAKTPTHYCAVKDGKIVSAPRDNIAEQPKHPLPEFEGLNLNSAEICGITSDWLFINCWETTYVEENGYMVNQTSDTVVTFRIALYSWEPETVVESFRRLPWYNPASDSLLCTSRFLNEEKWKRFRKPALSPAPPVSM